MEVKRAIVLDMDNTLEVGVQNEMDDYTMFLRPNIDAVISKLKEAKENGIDIILCTTADNEWVERFLALKPEFKELFTKIYSRDNKYEWQNVNYEDYPIESMLGLDRGKPGKPVTTWGYNSILFIDDSPASEGEMERIYADSILDYKSICIAIEAFSPFIQDEIDEEEEELIEMYDMSSLTKVIEYLPENIRSKFPSKSIDTTFFKVPPFLINFAIVARIIKLINDQSINADNRKKIIEFIENENKEPGCKMICNEIDKFMSKEFMPGLTMTGKDYEQEITSYRDKVREIEKSLPYSSYKCPQEVINKYMSQDKEAPYIGIFPREISINSAVSSLIRREGVIEKIKSQENEPNKNNDPKKFRDD